MDGKVIANTAVRYVGYGYVWGGRAAYPGDWDCSSYVSYVLGHDLGLPLPGGRWGDPGFPPHQHGPTTYQYLNYGSPVSRSEVEPGILVVWNTHMGIAINRDYMVSARDPSEGVGEDFIDNDIVGEVPHFKLVGGVARVGGTEQGEIALGGRNIEELIRASSKQLWTAGTDKHNSAMSIRKHRIRHR